MSQVELVEHLGLTFEIDREIMSDVIIKSLLCLDPLVISNFKKVGFEKNANCFELFGYDFILDADFNTWLIEVNTNPCIEESSSILKRLIPRMIAGYGMPEFLRITVGTEAEIHRLVAAVADILKG